MNILKTLTVCFFVIISTNLFAQNTSQKVLMIEIRQSANYPENGIIVSENSEKLEELSLAKYNDNNFDYNQLTINKVIAKYILLGYKIISSVRGSVVNPTNDTVMVTTYIFVKEF